jgi:hypothetical protein
MTVSQNRYSALIETIFKAHHRLAWIIKGAGKSRYLFKQSRLNRIEPDEAMLPIKVPNATPEILLASACDDEQALLGKDRIALFELALLDGDIHVVDQKHYTLVSASEISSAELKRYNDGYTS